MRPHRCHHIILALALLGVSAPAAIAQQTTPAAAPAAPVAPAQMPVARPADVASPDAIIAALYDVISGAAGQKRDWDRFRSLFIPNARLIPTGRAQNGAGRHRVMTPEEYAAGSGPVLERDGFYEREIGRKMERYGNIVHVMSAYDSKRTLADAQPFARGINSIQLWNDGTRWYVVTIFWEAETASNPIPDSYFRAP